MLGACQQLSNNPICFRDLLQDFYTHVRESREGRAELFMVSPKSS